MITFRKLVTNYDNVQIMTEKLKLQSPASFQREILITVIQVKRNDFYV